MKCPGCDFVCSELRDICPRCLVDLRGHKKLLGLPVVKPDASYKELCGKVTATTTAKPKSPNVLQNLLRGVKKTFFDSSKKTASAKTNPIPQAQSVRSQSESTAVPLPPRAVARDQSTRDSTTITLTDPVIPDEARISQWFDSSGARTRAEEQPRNGSTDALLSGPREQEALNSKGLEEEAYEIEPIEPDYLDDLSDVSALIKVADQLQHGETLDYPETGDTPQVLPETMDVSELASSQPSTISSGEDTLEPHTSNHDEGEIHAGTLALSEASHLDELVAQALEEALKAPRPVKPVQSDDLDLHFEFFSEEDHRETTEETPAGAPAADQPPITDETVVHVTDIPATRETNFEIGEQALSDSASESATADADDDDFVDVFEDVDVVEIEDVDDADDSIEQFATFDDDIDSPASIESMESVEVSSSHPMSPSFDLHLVAGMKSEDSGTRFIASLETPLSPTFDEEQWRIVDEKLLQATEALERELSKEPVQFFEDGFEEPEPPVESHFQIPGPSEQLAQDSSLVEPSAQTESVTRVFDVEGEDISVQNDAVLDPHVDSLPDATFIEEPSHSEYRGASLLPSTSEYSFSETPVNLEEQPTFVESLARVDEMLQTVSSELSIDHIPTVAEVPVLQGVELEASDATPVVGDGLVGNSGETSVSNEPLQSIEVSLPEIAENAAPETQHSTAITQQESDTIDSVEERFAAIEPTQDEPLAESVEETVFLTPSEEPEQTFAAHASEEPQEQIADENFRIPTTIMIMDAVIPPSNYPVGAAFVWQPEVAVADVSDVAVDQTAAPQSENQERESSQPQHPSHGENSSSEARDSHARREEVCAAENDGAKLAGLRRVSSSGLETREIQELFSSSRESLHASGDVQEIDLQAATVYSEKDRQRILLLFSMALESIELGEQTPTYVEAVATSEGRIIENTALVEQLGKIEKHIDKAVSQGLHMGRAAGSPEPLHLDDDQPTYAPPQLFERGGAIRRSIAFAIDWILISALSVWVTVVFESSTTIDQATRDLLVSDFSPTVQLLLVITLSLLPVVFTATVLLWCMLGTTIGTKLTGLTIMTSSGHRPAPLHLFVRSMLFPITLPLLGWAPLLWRKAPLHDVLARTRVLRRRY